MKAVLIVKTGSRTERDRIGKASMFDAVHCAAHAVLESPVVVLQDADTPTQ